MKPEHARSLVERNGSVLMAPLVLDEVVQLRVSHPNQPERASVRFTVSIHATIPSNS
jgi:hypothetical protein